MVKTITKTVTFTEIIKKSKFITFLHPIASIDMAKELVNKYKEEYKDATHVCYSYILDENTYKYYDDGEPNNSAGMPIYQVLKNNKLIYIFCVVIRYFGGVKLGVGGLNHAYSSGAINTLKLADIIEYRETHEYIIETNYSMFDSLLHYLDKKGIVINDKQFLDNIFISLILDNESLNEIKDNFPTLKITLFK